MKPFEMLSFDATDRVAEGRAGHKYVYRVISISMGEGRSVSM